MKRIVLAVFVWFSFSLFTNCLVFGGTNEFDDLKRSFKDLDRSMEQDSIKGVELQKDDQLKSIKLQKNDQLKRAELQKGYQLPQQKIRPLTQDMSLGNQPATNKAMLRNQQLFKKMMDEKKGVEMSMEAWGLKIPAKFRLIVELIAIALFVSFFGFMFYKREVEHTEKEKASKEDGQETTIDGITFYTPNKDKDKDSHKGK